MAATRRAAQLAATRAFAGRTAIVAPEVAAARSMGSTGGGVVGGGNVSRGWVAVSGGWQQRWGGSSSGGSGNGVVGGGRGFAADASTPEAIGGGDKAAAAKDPDDDRVVDMNREDFPNASPRVIRLADDICSLTLLEVHDMTEILKKRLNIKAPIMMVGANQAAAMMAGGGGAAPGAAGGAPGAPAAAAEEQTEFTVKLESFDSAQKIKVIKEVRAITELGLKEAKDLVEGAPAVLKKGLKKEDAEAIKEKISKVGGVVVLE